MDVQQDLENVLPNSLSVLHCYKPNPLFAAVISIAHMHRPTWFGKECATSMRFDNLSIKCSALSQINTQEPIIGGNSFKTASRKLLSHRPRYEPAPTWFPYPRSSPSLRVTKTDLTFAVLLKISLAISRPSESPKYFFISPFLSSTSIEALSPIL